MNRPSTVALWLLRRSGASEALTGDLIETFHQGRSRAWFWKQVLIVIALTVLTSLGQHWPHLAFAVTGTLSPFFLEHSMFRLQSGIPWWDLSWPWSMLVFEGSFFCLIPLAAAPVLIVGQLARSEFRWAGLLRTLLFAHSALLFIPYWGTFLAPPGQHIYIPRNWSAIFCLIATVPGAVILTALFVVLLASAWLGCRSPRRALNWKQEHL